MNIKDPESVKLAEDLGRLLNTGKTGAVRHALTAQLEQLRETSVEDRDRRRDAAMFMLNHEIWPHTQGAKPITKAGRQKILHPATRK